MSTARDAILQAIRRARGREEPHPAYCYPAPPDRDLAALFMARAKGVDAEVRAIAARGDAPAAVAALLSSVDAPPRLHIPLGSSLAALPWQRAGLATVSGPPGSEDAALSEADYAIAETGTLGFASGAGRPAAWHFLPGREIVLIARANIVPRAENVFAALTADRMPATLNLVSGPSRTGDIEQTIELGAHGPRAVHILVYGN